MDATFHPRNPDGCAFGGDGASKLTEQREELKHMDQRIVPFLHEERMNDYLKNVDQLHGPSGQVCSPDILKGRLVGLLFFTNSEHSLSFIALIEAISPGAHA